MTITEYDKAKAAADTIKPQLPDSNVKTAIICGTGLGGIADVLIPNHIVQISYKDIPHFKTSTVSGHAGKLIIGYMPGQNGRTKVPVICMSGRLHSYEGYDIKDTVLPIRTFQLLGIDTIIVTNAAGGLNQSFRVGDIMLLDDVGINCQKKTPTSLLGFNTKWVFFLAHKCSWISRPASFERIQ